MTDANAWAEAGVPVAAPGHPTRIELPDDARCARHPDGRAATICARCGSYACAECVFAWVPREICVTCAAAGLGEPVPWERRKEIGIWKAFWQTTRLVSRQPTRFFRTPPTVPGVVEPVIYGVAAYTVGQLFINVVLSILIMIGGGIGAAVADEPTIGLVVLGYGAVFGVIGIFATVAQAPVYGVIGILVAAALAHGMLKLMKKAEGTFEDTVRAVAYANGPYVWSWIPIPIIGAFVGWIWMVVAETIAVRETHRLRTDRAVLAVVLYRALFFLLIVGGYALVVLLIFTAERGR